MNKDKPINCIIVWRDSTDLDGDAGNQTCVVHKLTIQETKIICGVWNFLRKDGIIYCNFLFFNFLIYFF